MKIAVIQIDTKHDDPRENFKLGMKYLEQAAKYQAQCAILPEHWTVETVKQGLLEKAQSVQEFLPKLQEFAKENNLHLFSPMYRVEGKKIYNSLYVINRAGQLVETYDKIYLFKAMDEDTFNVPGSEIKVVKLDDVTFGLNVCFDLRFSNLAWEQTLKGAQVLLYPAQWGAPRVQHWQALLTARAIENQAYVVGCDRYGKSHYGELAGYSRVIDPWGEVVEGLDSGEGIFVANLDMAVLNRVRAKIPMERKK